MANKLELDKAIAAHSMGKSRLRKVIETGITEKPIETIRRDDQCEFGKWLYGSTLTSADKASTHFKTVQNLHAEFHQTAAKVVELALAGKKETAERMMASDGAYMRISASLTQAMMSWKASLG